MRIVGPIQSDSLVRIVYKVTYHELRTRERMTSPKAYNLAYAVILLKNSLLRLRAGQTEVTDTTI